MQHILFTTLALTLSLASSSDLDRSFGVEGKVIDDFFGLTDVAENVLVDAQNRILISGGASKISHNDHFAMARYNSDGTRDSSFGNKGKVATKKIGENKFLEGGIEGMGLQSDGKIVTCGRVSYDAARGLVLIRYNNDGSIDDSFGIDSFAFRPDSSETYYPLALVIDNDDKIIVVASAFLERKNSAAFAVFRFNSNGESDDSFGENGLVTTRISGGVNVPRAVKIDKDGKIVVGGFSGKDKFTVVRYNSNGSLDNSFGNQGTTNILFNDHGTDTLHALVIQEDGKIVIGGDVQVGSFAGIRMVDFGLARLMPNGELDLTFNKTGRQITSFVQPAASTLWALALQSDGKIIAIGDASSVNSLGVARYNTDGTLDETFGENGQKITACGKTCHWEAVALQPDGKIVVAGYIWNGKQYDMAVVRHNP